MIRGTGGTTNYGSLGVAGSIYLTPGVFISAHVYSSSDNSYRVQVRVRVRVKVRVKVRVRLGL